MQINASTYETIFLLYIDNELSPKERLQVEAWIAENPAYAVIMEELKATIVTPEIMRFSLKDNLKKQEAEASTATIEKELSENWNQEYTDMLTEEMQSIPGLTAPFKNSLKKETASKGILIKGFGFNQNKFTYTAVAAMLMLFIGYKQFTKSPESNLVAANTPIKKDKILMQEIIPNQTTNSSSNNIQSNQSVTQPSTKNVLVKSNDSDNSFVTNSNALSNQSVETKETIAIVAPIELTASANSTNLIPEKEVNTLNSNPTNTNDSEDEMVKDTNTPVSYEVIDTDDPNRSLLIANFEIDGNRLRGLKRKVNSLFKNNKSDRNK
jgi:hypothetical protein